MLNQESRAVEAARAANGMLTVLGWGIEHEKPVKSIDVTGEGFYAPLPKFLFQKNKESNIFSFGGSDSGSSNDTTDEPHEMPSI